jgi:acyl carrier protein phosphodiesterase
MNYLMHLYLAGDDRESLVGNMMGDFVKGRLDDRYSPGIRSGITLHRKIDSFAAGNRFFKLSKKRLDDSNGHYKGILVDIFYDHFLAGNWEGYSKVPFPEYIRHVYAILEDFEPVLPDRLRHALPRMFSSNWLLSYQELGGVDSILKRMSGRIARPNPLGGGLSELTRNYALLQADFDCFMPEIRAFVSSLGNTAG